MSAARIASANAAAAESARQLRVSILTVLAAVNAAAWAIVAMELTA